MPSEYPVPAKAAMTETRRVEQCMFLFWWVDG
jgi:hypothetical protein